LINLHAAMSQYDHLNPDELVAEFYKDVNLSNLNIYVKLFIIFSCYRCSYYWW